SVKLMPRCHRGQAWPRGSWSSTWVSVGRRHGRSLTAHSEPTLTQLAGVAPRSSADERGATTSPQIESPKCQSLQSARKAHHGALNLQVSKVLPAHAGMVPSNSATPGRCTGKTVSAVLGSGWIGSADVETTGHEKP